MFRDRHQTHLRVVGTTFGVRDERVGRKEGGRHGDGSVEQAARVVAQVEHDALHRDVALLEHLVDVLREQLAGVLLELRDAEVAVAGFEQLRLDRLDLDDGAVERDDPGFRLALADDRERDRGVGLAAHLLDGIVQGHALHIEIIELDDHVARLDAGAERGGVLDGRDHLHEPLFHPDLDAEAAELALRAGLEILEGVDVEVGRVRIEARQHAVDRLGDELLVLDGLDVVGLDATEDVGEGADVLDGDRTGILLCDGGEVETDQYAEDGAHDDQSCLLESREHSVLRKTIATVDARRMRDADSTAPMPVDRQALMDRSPRQRVDGTTPMPELEV